MFRAAPAVRKMASTHGGMNSILKRRLPVQRYIELAVKAGSYKSPSTRPNYLGLHDVPETKPAEYLTPREREERLKLRRGIIDYPSEYEILSLNPPLPTPPRTPVRVRKKIIADKRRRLEKLKKEQRRRKLLGEDVDSDMDIRELPSMDSLVKSYLRRHEERIKSGVSPSQTRREEEYYNNLLLGRHAKDGGVGAKSASSLHTAMGRKSALVENAYAFALRQQQIMIRNDALMTERESIEKVEEMLRDEARSNRQMGRKTADEVEEWSKGAALGGGVRGGKEQSKGETAADDDVSTLPSILHDRPRAIRALNIWSARLSSIPYARWTIGASTALDHWIAREVLQMSEETWQLVLEGGGTDAYHVANSKGINVDTLPGGESRRGLLDRMRDIVVVRGALFPETLVAPGSAGANAGTGGALRGDLDDDLLASSEKGNATEKSIDELLASLGMDDDDDDDGISWKFDDDDDDTKNEDAKDKGDSDDIDDEKMASIMDELQVWRGRNASSPYEAWDVDRKDEFDTKEFWGRIGSETNAELFLRDYRADAEKKLNSIWAMTTPTEEDRKLQLELEAILSVPFDVQLDKLANMGTLRPILDNYAPGKERKAFLEKYAHIFLEGLEMEHLVTDPDGPIGLEDVGPDLREQLSREWKPSSSSTGGGSSSDNGQKPRFAIRMVAYGTDEYGTARAERARELYRLWNEHKANRARFEEALFKRGHLDIGYDEFLAKHKERKLRDRIRREKADARNSAGSASNRSRK
ncbi:hypothetical protein ACHAXA_000860 [Cyclostephanos tholiformis]|uniref:Uncharacterized protein n=1 Tax=Cyclostephanos tholiformis TaxID=382380 RepID=A0ABD3SQL3_9STRA